MRQFSEFEKSILKRIANIGLEEDFEDFDIARIIRKELSAFAVKWDPRSEGKYTPYVTIYVKQGDNPNKYMHRLFDIINLFHYLQKNAWIVQLENTNNEKTYPRFLYDKENYEEDSEGNIVSKAAKITMFGEEYIFRGYTPNDSVTLYAELSKKLDILASSYVYPTSILIDFVENGYQTIEERQHREQMREAKVQTKLAIAAFVSSIVALIISTCMNSTIDKEQMQQIIKSMDKIENIQIPPVINTCIINDILKVDVVEKKQTTTLKKETKCSQ